MCLGRFAGETLAHRWHETAFEVPFSQEADMDSQRPPNPPPGNNGTPPGKGDGNSQRNNQPAQQLIDVFGSDMYAAVMALVLVLLGLMSASMTRCICT